jgi:hypothetical protein
MANSVLISYARGFPTGDYLHGPTTGNPYHGESLHYHPHYSPTVIRLPVSANLITPFLEDGSVEIRPTLTPLSVANKGV